ncbi:MAG: hypothetical protein KQ78_00028 [Candidatus Izimaplasma bacterium HR2]|nr:MAG: hypothetical protein KQ78_00028 [Candidatus Izimaplasma bacterium HR2]
MKSKYKVGEKVGFSEKSKTAVKPNRWEVDATQLVNRGWAIIHKIIKDDIGVSYKLQGNSYTWHENELEKIKIDILPDDLFEI